MSPIICPVHIHFVKNMNDDNILRPTGDDFILAKRTNLKGKSFKARDVSADIHPSRAIYINIGLSCQRENTHRPRTEIKYAPRTSFTPLKMNSF